MQPLSNVISGLQFCYGLNGISPHCKSCPYDNYKKEDNFCDYYLMSDALEYLKILDQRLGTEINSITGVPVLPSGCLVPQDIAQPKRTLDEVISAFDICNRIGGCDGCPYQESDICGEDFGNDARFYLKQYKESLNHGN